MRGNTVALIAAVAAGGCQDYSAPEARPLFEVSDAAHGGANAHFYFLPPMVPAPDYTGTFDQTVSPVVSICAWSGTCESSIASFDLTGGPGSETVRVVPLEEHYIVNWHTDQFAVTVGQTYRIDVSASGIVLGYVDVVMAESGREAKNLATGEIVALKDGRTLPIKFRIEEGAIPRSLMENGDFSDGLTGWQWHDDCDKDCIGPGYNEYNLEDGRAVIHSHQNGGYGFPHLYQQFAHEIIPTRFSGEYRQAIGTGCGYIQLGLLRPGGILGEDMVLVYRVGEQDVYPQYAHVFRYESGTFVDHYYFTHNDRRFEEGSLDVTFDWDALQAVVTVTSDAGASTGTLSIPADFRVGAVFIGAANACWDGRDDQTGVFDNIVLEGYTP